MIPPARRAVPACALATAAAAALVALLLVAERADARKATKVERPAMIAATTCASRAGAASATAT